MRTVLIITHGMVWRCLYLFRIIIVFERIIHQIHGRARNVEVTYFYPPSKLPNYYNYRIYFNFPIIIIIEFISTSQLLQLDIEVASVLISLWVYMSARCHYLFGYM
jgi:hypothetical protein